MKKILLRLSIAASVCISALNAQSVYVPVNHDIYEFLKRMEARKLLTDYKDAALPLSRMQIASKLKVLENLTGKMTKMERETYEFMKTEFNYELLKISGDPEPSETRWHIYSHPLSQGILNFDLNYSISKSFEGKESYYTRKQGLKTYGYVYDKVGFYFNLVDNLEHGTGLDFGRLTDNKIDECWFLSGTNKEYFKRVKSMQRGVVVSQVNGTNQFQYDEMDGQLSWQTGSFTFSLEKMNNIWGYGRNGGVILSDHAPSYPQIKMSVPLSNDINFVYFHGELNSDIVDSSESYIIKYPDFEKKRVLDHPKYIAAHQLEISLWNGVDLSLGESVIYSDRGPSLVYLIPVMFFKAAEHYGNDKDNCQIFGSLDLNLIRNTNVYLSLFIDEINTDRIFDPNKSHRQIAFTCGVKTFDVPWDNMNLSIEYARVNPATYNHNVPSNTFANNGFSLGSWMGQNADDLFFEIGFRPGYSLKLTGFTEVFRKGGDLPIADQYSEDQGNWKYLFGPLHVERSFGITARYQILRDVFVDFKGMIKNIYDENDPSMNRTDQFEYYLGASLGIW